MGGGGEVTKEGKLRDKIVTNTSGVWLLVCVCVCVRACTKHYPKYFILVNSFNLPHHPEVSTILIPASQMRKLRTLRS